MQTDSWKMQERKKLMHLVLRIARSAVILIKIKKLPEGWMIP